MVVAVDKTPFAVSDASRAIQSMLLAAWADGVGSNWVGFGGLEEVKTLLGIPAKLDLLAILPLGYSGAGRGAREEGPEADRGGRPPGAIRPALRVSRRRDPRPADADGSGGQRGGEGRRSLEAPGGGRGGAGRQVREGERAVVRDAAVDPLGRRDERDRLRRERHARRRTGRARAGRTRVSRRRAGRRRSSGPRPRRRCTPRRPSVTSPPKLCSRSRMCRTPPSTF